MFRILKTCFFINHLLFQALWCRIVEVNRICFYSVNVNVHDSPGCILSCIHTNALTREYKGNCIICTAGFYKMNSTAVMRSILPRLPSGTIFNSGIRIIYHSSYRNIQCTDGFRIQTFHTIFYRGYFISNLRNIFYCCFICIVCFCQTFCDFFIRTIFFTIYIVSCSFGSCFIPG